MRRLTQSCRTLPEASDYRFKDYIDNLMNTVLDFQNHRNSVAKSCDHFAIHARHKIRTHADLKRFLRRYPNSNQGNTEAALALWGNRRWNRVELLRRLLVYFEDQGVHDQSSLRAWLKRVDFKRDVKGQCRGFGFVMFKWLQLKSGIDTIKPDLWVKRFLESAIGRVPADEEIVYALREVAQQLGIRASDLDARIWEAGTGYRAA